VENIVGNAQWGVTKRNGDGKGLQGGIVYRKTRTSLERMDELLDGDSQVLELMGKELYCGN
jgi:hypothetical protein